MTVAVLGLAACGGAMTPQVARPIATEKMIQQGAMADSSQAWKIAFWADPGQKPEIFEVNVGLSGVAVAGPQWTVELARVLNKVVAKVGRFDERFQEYAVQIFDYEVNNGDIVYRWRPTSPNMSFGSARVAKLTLKELAGAGSGVEGVGTKSLLEVTLAGWAHVYACEITTTGDWMAKTMACLGERVLGDPSFWKAVEGAN